MFPHIRIAAPGHATAGRVTTCQLGPGSTGPAESDNESSRDPRLNHWQISRLTLTSTRWTSRRLLKLAGGDIAQPKHRADENSPLGR
jgi:hypothetical protein